MTKSVKSVRIGYETWMGLRALTPYGDSLDDTVQKLIRFYLAKHTDSKKSKKSEDSI